MTTDKLVVNPEDLLPDEAETKRLLEITEHKRRVYTLSGQLVRTFPKTDGATQDLVWYPVSDDHGRSVASGVYLYVIEGDSGRKTGKLMIIR